MAARFVEASTNDIDDFIQKSKSFNTTKSTNKWMSVYVSWAKLRNKEIEIQKLPPVEPELILQVFFAEVKKQNGDDYEPNSLSAMQSSIDRHLKNCGYLHSILRDREFVSSRSVLEGKARLLR